MKKKFKFVHKTGKVFEDMSMEGRMTVCNLSIEMGARGGMIAPDEKTIEYIKDREFTPKGNSWKNALKYWNSLHSDIDANFDKDISFDGSQIDPMITFGTNPGMGISISNKIPNSTDQSDNEKSYKRSLNYMNFKEGENMIGKKIDYIELYPASEGFIAYQDSQSELGMLLQLNSGIFYEFIPAHEYFDKNCGIDHKFVLYFLYRLIFVLVQVEQNHLLKGYLNLVAILCLLC